MYMRTLAWFALLVLALSSCSMGFPAPEITAREIVKAAIAKDIALLTARLSGFPLRLVLAAGNQPERQEAVCKRLVRLEALPTSWRLRFARAVYQDDGSSVNLHLCLQYDRDGRLQLSEMFWKMSLVEGGWKLVSYN